MGAGWQVLLSMGSFDITLLFISQVSHYLFTVLEGKCGILSINIVAVVVDGKH